MRLHALLLLASLVTSAETPSTKPLPPAEGSPVAPAFVTRLAQALPTARVTPATPRRLLVLTRTDSFRHSSINEGCEMLRQVGAATKAFTPIFSNDLADLNPERLAQFDGLVLLNTTGLRPTPSQQAAFLAFVREQGRGLIGIHAAIDNFPDFPAGQACLGGHFRNHPWRANDLCAVKVDDPQHPVVAAFGGHGFWFRDEMYQVVGPYARTDLRVVLSLDMTRPENARPAKEVVRTDNDFGLAWVARRGKGRLFYSCLGHNPATYAHPVILQHYLDGIQYALGDLPAPDEPSSSLPPTTLPALAPVDPTPLPEHRP